MASWRLKGSSITTTTVAVSLRCVAAVLVPPFSTYVCLPQNRGELQLYRRIPGNPSARPLHEYWEFESRQFSPRLRPLIPFQTHVKNPQIPRITRLIVGCRAGCHCLIGCQHPNIQHRSAPLDAHRRRRLNHRFFLQLSSPPTRRWSRHHTTEISPSSLAPTRHPPLPIRNGSGRRRSDRWFPRTRNLMPHSTRVPSAPRIRSSRTG